MNTEVKIRRNCATSLDFLFLFLFSCIERFLSPMDILSNWDH